MADISQMDPSVVESILTDQAQTKGPSWLKGNSRCGLTGATSQPNPACWIWFAIILIGYGMNIIQSLKMAANKYECRSSHTTSSSVYAIFALLGIGVGLLSLYIFDNHCKNCNGWQGFFITLVIGLVFTFLSTIFAPLCLPPDTHTQVVIYDPDLLQPDN